MSTDLMKDAGRGVHWRLAQLYLNLSVKKAFLSPGAIRKTLMIIVQLVDQMCTKFSLIFLPTD